MFGYHFPEWRTLVSSRKKSLSILDAFKDEPLDIPKYVCAPIRTAEGPSGISWIIIVPGKEAISIMAGWSS
jgi:hypothetical protein